ncbi:hypothetical protein SFC65_19860 [Priestia filamentosa]|uniref:hypothetical protein n=1 Tax=Priestia filamentosa TaxID=1402861 RepID=UPI003982B538
MTNKQIKMTPYEYGKKACREGKVRIPGLDTEFLLSGHLNVEVGEGLKPLNQWLQGWDDVHLVRD